MRGESYSCVIIVGCRRRDCNRFWDDLMFGRCRRRDCDDCRCRRKRDCDCDDCRRNRKRDR